MYDTYKDLVDYVLCNTENEELCNMRDKEYNKLIKDIVDDLYFDSEFNDFVDNRIKKYLLEQLSKRKEVKDNE